MPMTRFNWILDTSKAPMYECNSITIPRNSGLRFPARHHLAALLGWCDTHSCGQPAQLMVGFQNVVAVHSIPQSSAIILHHPPSIFEMVWDCLTISALDAMPVCNGMPMVCISSCWFASGFHKFANLYSDLVWILVLAIGLKYWALYLSLRIIGL